MSPASPGDARPLGEMAVTAPPLRRYQVEALGAIDAFWGSGGRRALVALPTGCHRVGQRVLRYDGELVAVEDIRAGDELMGPDGLARLVLDLRRGRDEMVEIRPVKGEPWTVNIGHVLTLVRTRSGHRYPSHDDGGIVDVTVADWLRWSKTRKHIYKLFRVAVDFPVAGELPLDPYFLGVLLGDGDLTRRTVSASKPDHEVEAAFRGEGERWGLDFRRYAHGDRCPRYVLARRRGQAQGNPIVRVLDALGLMEIASESRFVPQLYKVAPRAVRLGVLAGLLDTDGYYGGREHCCYDYISKSPTLANDVAYIARSVGLAAYVKPSEKYCQTGAGGVYWRVQISGDCSIVPCRIERKRALPRRQKKSVLRTGFSAIRTGAVEDYYGFTLDGDGRYLLDDFTVTHNSGKTVLFARIPERFPGKQVLFLAHREELLDQAAAKLAQANPRLRVEVEQAERRAAPDADVVVASVPTLGRAGSRRIEKFDPAQFAAIVVDEAHHFCETTASYQRIGSHFGIFEPAGALLLGVSATPFRGDDGHLGAVFEDIVYQRSILDLIEDGWLSPFRAFTVRTGISLDGVRTVKGEYGSDFSVADLADTVNTPARNVKIVQAWLQLAADRKRTLVNCVDVEHAYALRDVFRAHEIDAEAVLGETPKDERREIIGRYHRGELAVLCQCGIALEGFDSPGIDCVVWARPTKSPLLYQQGCGRASRLSPETGKRDALILDFVDNAKRHKIVSAASLFGMPVGLDLEGEDVRAAKVTVDKLAKENPQLEFDELESLSKALAKATELRRLLEERKARLEVSAQQVQIFDRARLGSPYSTLPWVKMPDGSFQISFPTADRTETIHYGKLGEDLLGHWSFVLMPINERHGDGFAAAPAAFRYADTWVRNVFPKLGNLNHSPTARWRQGPATEKQLATLERFGRKPDRPLTAGEAGDMLSQIFADLDRAKDGPPTEKQAYWLRQNGLRAEDYTKRTATAALDEIFGRER